MSLTSIMSTTGEKGLPGPTRKVRNKILAMPKNPSPEERRRRSKEIWRVIGSPGYARSDEEIDEFLTRVFERGMTTAGTLRQMLAINAAPSRREQLKKLETKTLVLHGNDDPLVPVKCGYATAGALKNSRLHVFPGMGHDFPAALLPELGDLIVNHMNTAATVNKITTT